jgi:outer membrane lipoprotein SlyB
MKPLKRTLVSTLLPAALCAISVPALAKCPECGTVSELKTVKVEGQGTGLGAIAGGVVGGVLGHQVGGGRGKDVATVAGAAGGAYVGHQMEKKSKTVTKYHVLVKMEEGNTRTFIFNSSTAYKVGDKVKVVNGKLTRV